MKKILKTVIPISVLLFLLWTIGNNWSLVGEKIASANIFLIFFSLIVLSLTYVGGAYFWYRILQSLSVTTPFKQAFRVFIVSNFGRFIPGVFLHYVARVYLAKGIGVTAGQGVSAVFLEAYYNIAGATLVSVLVLPLLSKFINFSWLFSMMIAVCMFVIFIRPMKIFTLLGQLPKVGKYVPRIVFKDDFKTHLSLLFLSTALFLLYGVALFLLASAFIENPLLRILDLSGLLAASWIIGFLTPVAPGGLGVSDFSLAFLLKPFYDFSFASFLALSFRFNLFLAEGLMFVFVLKMFGFDVVSSGKKD